MQFLGMVCKNADLSRFQTRDWVEISGTVRKEFQKAFNEEGPVIYVKSIAACTPPEQEVIGF